MKKKVMKGTIWKAPTHFKVASMGFTVIIPVICFCIAWYFLDTGTGLDEDAVILPVIFGLIFMIFGLKDALTVEKITTTDNRIIYQKMSKKTSIPFSEITRVYFIHIRARLAIIEAADRKYMMIYGATVRDSISCADKFTEKDQKYLRKILRKKQHEFGYEIISKDVYTKADMLEVFQYIHERDMYEKGGKSGKKGKGGNVKKFSLNAGAHVQREAYLTQPQEEYETGSEQYPCPNCGQILEFIDEYNKWYCYTCNQYM